MFRRISVSSSSKQKGTNESIHSFLIDWGTKFNISNLALDELLLEFHKKGYTNLPRCTKTLMKVPRRIRCVETIGDEIYCHPGIEKCLSAYCCALKKTDCPFQMKLFWTLTWMESTTVKAQIAHCGSYKWVFESRVESIDLDIFYVEGEIKFSEDKLVDLSNIYAKMFVMPVKQRLVFFPIYI